MPTELTSMRLDTKTKEQAKKVLDKLGLNVSVVTIRHNVDEEKLRARLIKRKNFINQDRRSIA